ncbi:uncharacterized protein LOC126990633 isoform X1 [Eriocheir sinensis]|uniref:uncharacterized protein LOC126990633 isoform X1 n=1 Tax=Eriocheir sinensis TaxID=95602 RepID=UPI0021C84AD0|nr:uncharacterized protein LOC126990633 isoform X1 [Eriocheir sinensis]
MDCVRMDCDEEGRPPASVSPGIAAEEERVRRRRSTLGGRACRSIGGRLSLAAPPHPGLHGVGGLAACIGPPHNWPTCTISRHHCSLFGPPWTFTGTCRSNSRCYSCRSTHCWRGRGGGHFTGVGLWDRDQVLQVDEGQPWDIKLTQLLDIGLREAMRRLEARLPADECAPELRAAVFTQAGSMSMELAEHVGCFTPSATPGHNSFPTSASIEMYKEKTREMEEEYNKWKAMRRQREADCRTAEMVFQEAKSMVTTVDESQEAHLSPAQQSFLESWSDYSCYIEEALQAKERSQLVLQEVNHTTEVVNGLFTVSRLQAESSYTALENLSNAHLKKQPLTLILSSFMKSST